LAAGIGWATAMPGVRGRPGARRAAAAAGLVAGAGVEAPLAGVVSAAIGLVLLARRPRPSFTALLAGIGAGITAAATSTQWWPLAPDAAATVRRASKPVDLDAAADGRGVVMVVNPSSGPAYRADQAGELHRLLPAATLLELGPSLELDDALERAVKEGTVIGVAGGDGTVNAAAGAAVDAGLPLLVVPGGTLNHFARDLGMAGADDAAGALAASQAVDVDLGLIAGRPFLNTATFGSYSELVDARESLEPTIGKWPATVVALANVLRRSTPCEVEIDGTPRRVWMVFVGNCVYQPSGFAPAWRDQLDDGLLDIRLVGAEEPYARLRLIAAVITGQLARSPVYEAFTAERLAVRSPSGPMRLACDGETFDGPAEFEITKHPRRLTVLAPPA
jgi:undecaprenyl-diphosphatase